MTPADELRTAAAEMRAYWAGPASEATAQLLDSAAELATAYPDLARDHDRETCDDYACDLMGRSIHLARTITANTI
ncbi:hypothetical protein [Streptomyces sp. NK08204]|uniref:hypothetical protein n=1 Tax=Streptomyces sp. NK08204 TaxID=2873260 RepID=UPI001CED4DED|nr:hypothetical protein [Streptomyces sp. NK08204]